MKIGDTFVLDDAAVEATANLCGQAVDSLSGKVESGMTYGVSKSATLTSDVILASKWEENDEGVLKPKRGRPRRFPRATVLRLLGEEDTQADTAEDETSSEEVELDAIADETLGGVTSAEEATEVTDNEALASMGEVADSW